jgi:hypothetical protein
MVAVTDTSPDAAPAPAAVDEPVAAPVRNIVVVPTASLVTRRGDQHGVVLDSVDNLDHWHLVDSERHRFRAVRRRVRAPPPKPATSRSTSPTLHRAQSTRREDGDVIVAPRVRGPYLVNANTGQEQGARVVRVPQTTNREDAAAVVTARSETGGVVIDDLR